MDTKSTDIDEQSPLSDVSYDWRQVTYDSLEIILDQYTYMTIPNGLLEFYMDQKSLRWLIKMPGEKWVRMCIEKHVGGSNINILRWQHDTYVHDEVRYHKEWCFGILFSDKTIEGGNLLCTLKAINADDFREFALFLLQQANTAKREMNLLDRFHFRGNERK